MKLELRYTMTVGDVARVLGVSPDRVRQLDGKLRPVRRGAAAARRYDPSAVEKLLAARSVA